MAELEFPWLKPLPRGRITAIKSRLLTEPFDPQRTVLRVPPNGVNSTIKLLRKLGFTTWVSMPQSGQPDAQIITQWDAWELVIVTPTPDVFSAVRNEVLDHIEREFDLENFHRSRERQRDDDSPPSPQ